MMNLEKNKIYWLIGIATLVRIAIAFCINLGNDEVYYLTYAQHLQWNYFDHPPMVALLIRLTTLNLYCTTDVCVRLGAIILAAWNTYLVFAIAKQIKNEKAGYIAALLYTASLYSSIIAGVFILPDSPQLFFWLLAVSVVLKIVTSQNKNTTLNFYLIGFGILTGLCIMSKVHGVFLWIGFGLYILFYKRSLLSNGFLYLSVVLTIVIIFPILLWNVDNNFITYTFHSERVVINNGVDLTHLIREFTGGILYNNPINYFLIGATLFSLYKTKTDIAAPIVRILLLISLPLIIVVLCISIFRATLPHWTGPAYVTLLILVASTFEEMTLYFKQLSIRLVGFSVGLIVIISVAGCIVINNIPGTLGSKNQDTLGQGDPTLDMYNWDFFRAEFKKIHNENLKLRLTNTSFVINNKWFPGSHIDNYIVQPLHLNFIAVGKLEDIHTYAWLNKYRNKLKMGDDAYFITFSNSFFNPNDMYLNQFDTIQLPKKVIQYRNHKPVRVMYVYLLKGYKG